MESGENMRKSAGKHITPVNYGRNIVLVLLLLVFLGGLGCALYPVGTGAVLTFESRRAAEKFLQAVEKNTPNMSRTGMDSSGYYCDAASNSRLSEEADTETEVEQSNIPYSELLSAMKAYNERIFLEGQSGLCDAWSYQEPSFDLAEYGIEDGVAGVLNIPKINLEMPVYLGATYDNMAKGAAHLSQTSLPTGGKNTNCVIAGHRGWRGAPFFLDLDKLAAGDEVTLTNLWGTLHYKVSATKIIEPDDVDKVLIQPGQDMLTLITCHPYASGGKFRLVVYCERTDAV